MTDTVSMAVPAPLYLRLTAAKTALRARTGRKVTFAELIERMMNDWEAEQAAQEASQQ